MQTAARVVHELQGPAIPPHVNQPPWGGEAADRALEEVVVTLLDHGYDTERGQRAPDRAEDEPAHDRVSRS
jgi:hypothetical protein